MDRQNSHPQQRQSSAAPGWTNASAASENAQGGDQPAYIDFPVPQPHQTYGSPNQAHGASAYPSQQFTTTTYHAAPGGDLQPSTIDHAYGHGHSAHRIHRTSTMPVANPHNVDYVHGQSPGGLVSTISTGIPGHVGQYATHAEHSHQGYNPVHESASDPRMAVQRTHSGYVYGDPSSAHQQAAYAAAGEPSSSTQGETRSRGKLSYPVQGTGGGGSSKRSQQIPKCKIPDCPLEIFYDTHQKEWSDYCGDAHVLEAVARGLSPPCYRCGARPCRTGEWYCGGICKNAAAVAAATYAQRR